MLDRFLDQPPSVVVGVLFAATVVLAGGTLALLLWLVPTTAPCGDGFVKVHANNGTFCVQGYHAQKAD